MKKILPFIGLLLISCQPSSREIIIRGNTFFRGNKPVWFNGINTPWHHFDDFGAGLEKEWWEAEFDRYVENHINLVRVWIHCSGKHSPEITEDGKVTGASVLFFEDMDALVEMAHDRRIYLLPVLWSFDMTKEKYPTHKAFRKLVASKENLQSYIDNFLIPLVERYDKEEYLLGWEICNEPEWMFEDPAMGPLSVKEVQRFHALFAAAIHSHTGKPVTTGSAGLKWNSPKLDSLQGNAGNVWSDQALQKVFDDKDAYLDFYQIHWYPWQTRWMSSPYQTSTEAYGIDDRPVLIGETLGRDYCDDYLCMSLEEMYENALDLGYDGVCAWKTPQNDGAGTFEEIIRATNSFYVKHPELLMP